MPNLATILIGRVPLAIPLENGEVLNIEYNGGKFSPTYVDGMDAKSLRVIIPELILSWDLTETVPKLNGDGVPALDKKGEPITEEAPVPITEERIKDLPYRFLNTVLRAISGDQHPNSPKSAQSGSFN